VAVTDQGPICGTFESETGGNRLLP
jgi:hypothetical protein